MLQGGFDFFTTELATSLKSGKMIDSCVQGESLLRDNSFVSEINSRGQIVARKTTYGDLVDVYRNTNKTDCFSCRQVKGLNKSKVTGYGNVIVVENPVIKISQALQQRAVREHVKNVHCVIRATFIDAYKGKFVPTDEHQGISYNPFYKSTFYDLKTGVTIEQCNLKRFAIFYGSNVYLVDDI